MANCCVIGLGYIGLPTAVTLAYSGHKVSGCDINQNIVDHLNSGQIHISEPKLQDLFKKCLINGSFSVSTTPKESEIYIIAVPTPFKKNNKDLIPQPNINYVISAIKSLIPLLKPKDLIIIESTCPVETTSYIFKLIRDSIKFKAEDIFLAYCPERVIPGNILYELLNNDRVVGGINKASAIAAKNFYTTFCEGDIHISNSETAEMVKLTENAFRDVNIAFANELSMICDNFNVDVKELINLANHHPRVNILNPGCGVGGHCIAVDPWFIVSKFPEIATLIKEARKVNLGKTKWVLDKIIKRSKDQEKLLKRKPIIGIFGITYKPNVDDIRESPALKIVMELLNSDQELIISDPYVKNNKTLKISSIEEVLNCADFIVSLVNHNQFEFLKIPKDKILDFTGKY